ncbi:MAG: aquaporin family protein [Micrococcales bacterium]|nr:aquaporin family protein [Micrococcales bacterium]OJX69627.1 MAG: aquaporin family protein [Micrococcales bacterium 72-143]
MTPSPPPAVAPLWRRALAEFLGAGLLVTVVIGSGIAAERLSPGDVGLQLLENSLATALGLAVLILVFQTVSGAHLNPVVTLADRALGARRGPVEISVYVVAQIAGGIGGAVLANTMFGVATTISSKDRLGAGHLLAEVVATAGLVLVIFALVRTGRAALVGPAVGAYIGAAYWFTSSTAFANPAVTLGRIFSDTFAGIAPGSALWFVGAQLVGGAIGLAIVLVLFPRKATP